MHTTEYLRKRTIVRWVVWTPITLALLAWVGYSLVTYPL